MSNEIALLLLRVLLLRVLLLRVLLLRVLLLLHRSLAKRLCICTQGKKFGWQRAPSNVNLPSRALLVA
jgi:hypothetical protein